MPRPIRALIFVLHSHEKCHTRAVIHSKLSTANTHTRARATLSVWFEHHSHDGPRRTAASANNTAGNEAHPAHYSKGHSQSHYSHHQAGQQYWNNYNNPRRSGAGNYTRNYSGGNGDLYWNAKSTRFPSHRSMNNLMNNAVNYQQQPQSSPPTQRRQGEQQYYHGEQQTAPSYYKSNALGGADSSETRVFSFSKRTVLITTDDRTGTQFHISTRRTTRRAIQPQNSRT